MRGIAVIFYLLIFFLPSMADTPAFPGAEGYGKYVKGGRGGKVIYVSNLNDDGPGSLRKAIQADGPRIVLFKVSGNIELQRPLDINKGDITIAGQTAPGDGICIKNYPVSIKSDNVVIRYIRFRLGDEKRVEGDAFGANHRNKGIIIDHCSISWATDECASFYRNSAFTMQWCIIAESLNASVHSKGEHGYGGIWGGEGASFHHNLIASHKSRMPRFSGSASTPNSPAEMVDFGNNVIYNWEINNIYGGERGRYNIVNNYFKAGPATTKSRLNQIVNPWSPLGKFYISGNILEGNESVNKNNWQGVKASSIDSARADVPFQTFPLNYSPAGEAYLKVLEFAGASLVRDAADQRLIGSVRTGKSEFGKNKDGIIDSQKDVGGWPVLRSAEAPQDTDNDGMPDVWEEAHQLDPGNPGDGSANTLDKSYTNVEVYINSLLVK